LELSSSSFRVVFRSGQGPYSGRVSLSPEIEVFDADGADESVLLRSVRVGLSGVATTVGDLRSALRRNASTTAKLVEVESGEA